MGKFLLVKEFFQTNPDPVFCVTANIDRLFLILPVNSKKTVMLVDDDPVAKPEQGEKREVTPPTPKPATEDLQMKKAIELLNKPAVQVQKAA